MPPFEAPRLKIERAKHHVRSLRDCLDAFVATRPVRWSAEPIVGDPWAISMRCDIDAMPNEVPAVIGDIVHNARTALDLVAADLVRHKKSSTKNVYFPICENQDDLREIIKRRNFDKAGQAAVKFVVALKPYRGGNISLRALHDLDIIDKHMAIVPGSINTAGPIIQMFDDEGNHWPTIVSDPNEPSDLKFVLPENVPLAGQELVPTLQGLVQLSEGIVESLIALADT